MKELSAAAAALIVTVLIATMSITFPRPASAGVVLEEAETIDQGNGPVTGNRTVMVQGNKQKTVVQDRALITDLDRGLMIQVDDKSKSFIEMPFPPTGSAAAMMNRLGSAKMNYTKTGGGQKVAGYSCNDYEGQGNMANRVVSVKGCFSTSAPGAAEFRKFQATMAQKAKGTPLEMLSQTPAGVPLKLDSSTKMTVPAGLPPDQAQKLQQMIGNRPPIVTRATVTKINERTLAASTFEAPAGYKKKDLSTMMPGGTAKPPPGASAAPAAGSSSSKVPE
jgi:hypothetical protein